MATATVTAADAYYIHTSGIGLDLRTRVLKQGETFGVFDPLGDIQPARTGEQGIFHEGTRYLSKLLLKLGSSRPVLLSSTVSEENDLFTADLTNPDMDTGNHALVKGSLYVFRSRFLWEGACFDRVRVWNYGLVPLETQLSIAFDADFADIFEVRGMERARRGVRLSETIEGTTVIIAYRGLDGMVRQTRLEWFPAPMSVSKDEVTFDVNLQPHGSATYYLTVSCEGGGVNRDRLSYENALKTATRTLRAADEQRPSLTTTNAQVNEWLNRSVADLHMMVTDTEHGRYPYAGVPWYSTAFGRDGIITALEMLWLEPQVARGVLKYLAATQATQSNDAEDAEPGKILHERRSGEMAALGEHPFRRYYGSVDATPLFIILAGEYYERTADLALIQSIWGNLELALKWLDTYGDCDGDGFIEYARHSPRGLVQQGWKDSSDSVFHADGGLAEGPIALCEVQAYAYGARLSAAKLATVMGRPALAEALEAQALELRDRFEQRFWCDELSTYALALDGHKSPCRVRTSNAGHCLLTGIARPDHARRVADNLLSEEGCSGWGIRTVAASEIRYNPMAYHNGSVWPHDNALIALGFSRYGLMRQAAQVLNGMFEASLYVDLHRLPELFCGFNRRPGEGPTLYPVACAPQAWASAAPFMLLQACLGLTINAPAREIRFRHPVLPEFLERVWIRGLVIGPARVDVVCQRYVSDVGINVLHREGDINIVTVK